MWVISRKKLREFWERYEDAEIPLSRWFKAVENAEWKSFNDIRLTFGTTVDQVGTCYVFNIHGNDYRLIAKISKSWKKVWVREVLTHGQYNLGKWKKGCA